MADREQLKNFTQAAVVLGVLAAVVLVIIAVVLGFSKEVRTLAITNVSALELENGTTNFGSKGTYSFIRDAVCDNSSGAPNQTGGVSGILTTADYATVEGTVSDDGFGGVALTTAGGTWNGTEVNCTFGYLADSTGSIAGETFRTGLTIFATFIGILVLAIVGVFIVRLYKGS